MVAIVVAHEAEVGDGKIVGKGAWREAGGGWEVRIGRGLCGQV